MALSARRLRLPLALCIAVIVGAIIYNRTREDRWRPLPGGGEIRCIAVTHEVPRTLHFEMKPSILEPLRSHLSPRWSHLLGPAPVKCAGTIYEPAVVVWFQVRNHPSGLWYDVNDFELIRGDGLNHYSVLFCYGQSDQNLLGVGFDDDCRNEPRLDIRCSQEAGSINFDIANPLLHDPRR